eukprot:Skav224096  [mRNA]  locus=scaffold4565:80649:82089:- [translate_table: standard]
MARTASVLPVVLLALGAWMLSSLTSQSFVNTASTRSSNVAMRGFKDDFYAWKDTLTSEDQALLLKQAQNEFNKKFRASDEFKKSIESFSKVLQKFFDNEREDYKKDVAMKTPDYDALQRKASQVAYDFGLKRSIIEVDRDADRRWSFATDKMKLAEDKGETFSDSAPLELNYLFANDGENHTENVKTLEGLNKAVEAVPELSKAGKDVKENLKSWAKQQEAELAEEADSVDRIRKALEEARR